MIELMEKMYVLLQFYILNRITKKRFLFWSCVLDSCFDISGFDLNYLNADFDIEGFNEFSLQVEYKFFTKEILNSEYKNYSGERPEIFLITDATMEQGSPYRHASSLMKTYYQVPSDFISMLTQFINIPSNYQFIKFQLQIISTIKKELGINIIKNESIPGCLSVYTRMPGFIVNGNYSALNGRTRYITITPEEMGSYENTVVELELLDDDKILFRKLCKYTSDFYYEFPFTDILEPFFEFRITIYSSEKPEEQYCKIYEEYFHLIRSIHFSGSIGGGHSRLVKNRFLQKAMDKIDVMHHQPFNTTLDKTDWIDWEREYRETLFGRDKRYLQSLFFRNDDTGRKDFLNWARKTISEGKRITLVDPFFDANGLNDFVTCIDTQVKSRILMKDPDNYKEEFKIDANTHLKNIFESLSDAQIFFIDTIHDRYLVVEEYNRTAVFSLSNSWNGTVNHHSLYVQEIPLLPALEILEEIENHTKNVAPQVNTFTKNKKFIESKKDKSVYTESYIDGYFKQLEAVTESCDPNDFILVCCELFWSHYYTDINKHELVALINKKVILLDENYRIILIATVVTELLKKQKERLIQKKRFIANEPFSYYDTPKKCIERMREKHSFGMNYYNLDLDYALYELLKSLFYLDPETVIAKLAEKEKEICVVLIVEADKKKPFCYYYSELIVCSFLSGKYPAALPLKDDTLELINKVKSHSYCRIFYAMAIIHHDRKDQLAFNEFAELFHLLGLTPNEFLLLSADMYCNFSLQKINHWNEEENDVLLNDIVSNILSSYSGRDIIQFAYLAYIEPYEIQIGALKQFIEQLETLRYIEEKVNVEKLLLLCAVQTNIKLQKNVKEIIEPPDYILDEIVIPPSNRKPENIDSAKYHNFIPCLGYLFASFLEKSTQKNKIKNIHHALAVDKSLVFQVYKFPASMGLFYYEVAFLLSTALSLKNSAINFSKGLLEWLDWYLPCCLNAHSDDFYGLSIQVIDLYTTLQNDERNKKLADSVHSIRDKILIASNTKSQTQEDIALYRKSLKNYVIGNEEKGVVLLLNIVINLCLRCVNNNEDARKPLLEILEQLRDDVRTLVAESVNKLMDAAITYAYTPSRQTEKIFIENMKAVYEPYSARYLLENSNEEC